MKMQIFWMPKKIRLVFPKSRLPQVLPNWQNLRPPTFRQPKSYNKSNMKLHLTHIYLVRVYLKLCDIHCRKVVVYDCISKISLIATSDALNQFKCNSCNYSKKLKTDIYLAREKNFVPKFRLHQKSDFA